MKFLLVAVNAKYIHSNPAIYSLRAYAGEELQPFVELAEYTINQNMQEILSDIYVRKPDIIGFSCYIWNWRMIQELLGELPKLLPGVPLWLGGPEVTYDAEQILQQYPQLAGIMAGEGEATFRELLEYYVSESAEAGDALGGYETEEHGSGKGSIKMDSVGYLSGRSAIRYDIGGSVSPDWDAKENDTKQYNTEEWNFKEVYKEGCKACNAERSSTKDHTLQAIKGLYLPSGYTSERNPIDLNTTPFLYHDLAPFENKIIYYESSRGCPFRCSYCLSSIDKHVRLRDISVVKRELQFFLDHNVKQVKFVDRTFNCSHAHTIEVWRYIQEHDNGVTNFHFEVSADLLTEEEITLLNSFRPGLAQLEIGVQSVNSMTLQAIRRVTNLEKLEKAVAAIRRGKNVHQHLDLIAGLPYEDYESFRNSFNRVYKMCPEQLQLGFLKVLKGSAIWEQAAEYGICYMEQPPYEVLYTKWLSYEDILRLKRIEEMVELYYNSAQFTHTLPFLEKAFPDPFSMYEALASFYEKRGYFTASPSRAYRYHILLAFVMEYDSGRQAVYRELLVYDMYLRENLKSRPEFAPELFQYKEAIRSFYQGEGRERRYLPEYQKYDWKQMMKMTHMEPFAWPVWDPESMAVLYDAWEESRDTAAKKGYFVLFDYEKRNPLNYEASVQHLDVLPVPC